MLVKDKVSDIAILRTMGIPRVSVLRIFLMVGAVLALGGLLGTALVLCF